ncbi:hypothetical protein ACFV1N_11670 [Streptosporangium canum]|uniref:hypothetical protein n=1 Tax=Streptosporangium canum TaxID=324952 RepID=UPI003699BDFB
MAFEDKKLAKKADQIKDEFLGAVNRGDMAEALQIGVDRLLPISEDLVERSAEFLNPLGMTLRNLSAICQRLGRPIGQFYFAQQSLHAAVLVEPHGYELHPGLADIAGVTATIAAELVGTSSVRQIQLTAADQDLLFPAAALIPQSMKIVIQLDSARWAAQMRLAATTLRQLSFGDLEIVDCECRAIVWLAQLSCDIGERGFAVDEIRAALVLWVDQLGSTSRYWSSELQETWTVAAETLDSLGKRKAAATLRGAIHQATAGRHGVLGLSDLTNVLDLRQYYEAAAAAL